MASMNKSRRDDVWGLLDDVGGQCLRLRDGSGRLIVTSVRHDYIEAVVDMRDKLRQVSELIEETIKVEV